MLRMNQMVFGNAMWAKDNTGLDEVTLAHKAGLLHKDGAGLFSLWTLGLLAQQRLEARLRQVFHRLGAQEIRLALMQEAALWDQTGRRAIYGDELMTVRGRDGCDQVLGATAEELVCANVRDLLKGQAVQHWVYQMGTKWRDELRCRAGLVRAKEFSMLDAYTFASDDAQLMVWHEAAQTALVAFFEGLGLTTRRVVADNGQMGGRFSEEIQVACSLGDVEEEGTTWLEVGHSFLLGTRFSEALGFTDHRQQAVAMGCQGVGISRTLMAWLATHRDARGFFGDNHFSIVDTVVTVLNQHKEGVLASATVVAEALEAAGHVVVLDDRDERAGKKLADSELVGARQRVVVSDRSLASAEYECLDRAKGQTTLLQGTDLV